MNAGRELYGPERLVAVWQRNFWLEIGPLTEAVKADIAAFTGGEPQRDDLTLLILRYMPD